MQVESHCSSYRPQCSQFIFFFFDSTLCWNFSTTDPDLCKGSLIHGRLSMLLFLGASRLRPRRAGARQGHCRVHIQDQGLYAYYLTHRTRLLPCPTTPTKVLLSIDKFQIIIFGRIQMRDLLFGHAADVTQKPWNVTLIELPL